MKIGIVGIGLIGGSFALAMQELGHTVVGFDASEEHRRKALELGLVSETLDIKHLAKDCDLIAVCVPVDRVVEVCTALLSFPGDSTVIELSSTKEVLAKALENNPSRKRIVLTHPMAGTEYSGPQAAVAGLFRGKSVVLCDVHLSDHERVTTVNQLFLDIGMRPLNQESRPHDLHVAYVSHISHISSFALSLTVLEKERDERQIFNLASGGFASTVRLAKSNPDTWTPIFEQNRDNVLDVLDEYINVLAEFRTALIKKNFKKVHSLMNRANAIGPMLPKLQQP